MASRIAAYGAESGERVAEVAKMRSDELESEAVRIRIGQFADPRYLALIFGGRARHGGDCLTESF